MVGERPDNNQLPRVIMQEVNAKEVLRVVADTQVVIQIAVDILHCLLDGVQLSAPILHHIGGLHILGDGLY